MQLSGNLFDYVVVFWGGVLVSFTPCVYPVLPLTAGFIAGINTKGSRLMGFVISLIYVFGIAITYSALAIFASLTGKVFGQFQNHPFVYFIVSLLLLVFALAMFDKIPMPTLGLSFHEHIKAKNVWTVIVFGMASGLVIGPCTAPVLGTLLLYTASQQNIWHAVSLMFVFSYGLGASLILVGTFSGILANLPRSGAWLVRIKQIAGVILLAAAGYFMYQAVMLILL
ncbi:MAG TPA: cytochrome c biogenesis protein CcdA [Candidatus Omnitrophota bacterium]|nr:cytochrome c biogenesis protein CcdA [Candidatus Omnitrophota bacterium]